MRGLLSSALNLSSSVEGAFGSGSMQRGGKHFVMPPNNTLPEELPHPWPHKLSG